MSALSASSQRHLKRLLELGHALEKTWPRASGAPISAEQRADLTSLQRLIAECESRAEPALQRLHIYARHLPISEELVESLSPVAAFSAQHLGSILVPFERLSGRALRDDDFIVDEGDAEAIAHERGPFTVICDSLRSAFNVGSILRTADGFGAESVILTGYTATPDSDKTARTALGAQNAVSWQAAEDINQVLDDVKARGYTVIALETAANAENLDDFSWPEKTALVLGNERFGLDADVLARADRILRIPLYGVKNSLNVGVAFGVVLAHWREQLERRRRSSAENRAVLDAKVEAHGPPKSETAPVQAIGIFHCSAVNPYEAPRQGSARIDGQEAVIELANGELAQGLKDLEGFERLWLIYRFHRNTNWKPLVVPPRGENVKRGVFATRSPYRPNQIGLSCVRLKKIEGHKIYVSEFDLLNGTPILDIKPYIPYADAFPKAKAGWTEGLENERHTVTFSAHAQAQLAWLEQHGITSLNEFIHQQLSFNPFDETRKRVARREGGHTLAYRTWRVHFMSEGDHALQIGSVSSGYSQQELADDIDTYSDKDIHRDFVKRWSV